MVGTTWVLRWKDAQGTASLGLLQDRLLRGLRASLKGRWSMDTRLFRASHDYISLQNLKVGSPTIQQDRGTASDQSMYVVARGHGQQRKQYIIMASNRVVIETDTEMESILLRLKNLWSPRQSARIEGYSYEGDDWIIRIGNMMIGTSYKGLVIEINYLPCSNPDHTFGLMKELLMMILPGDAQIDPNNAIDYRRAGLDPRHMTDRHTAYQYVHLFTQSSLL